MAYELRMSSLYNLPPDEVDKRIADWIERSNCPEAVEESQQEALNRVAAYARYNLTSQRMVEMFEEGELEETADICDWLMWLECLDSGE